MRPLIILSFIVSCAIGAAACSDSPSGPSAPGYAGEWSGSTTQGLPVSFTISADQKLIAVSLGYRVGTCTGTRTFTNISEPLLDPPPPQYPGPLFGVASPTQDGTNLTRFEGWFTSNSTAQGIALFIELPGCGTSNGIWSATKR